ncbi:MAG: hypothetical protein V1728_02675 [Candidatus Micrarchaeota archaeon]
MALIQIDQSGKWESGQPTAIGASVGGKPRGALIRPAEKDRINRILGGFEQEKNRSKKRKASRMFTYAVFLAIREVMREKDILEIDVEYQGQDDSIRGLLLHLFERHADLMLEWHQIQFGHVGRTTLAHAVAHQTFAGSRKPDLELKFDDFFRILDRTEEIRKRALKQRMKRKWQGNSL